jgi:hypothetical protein
LLHGPAVAVGIAEEHERSPREVLDVADIHGAAGELLARAASTSSTTSVPRTDPGAAAMNFGRGGGPRVHG